MKKKNKKTKTRIDKFYIGMLAIAVVMILSAGTYAYYQSTISGTVSGTIAKWSFKTNNQESTFDLDFGSLYPGKTGVYNLELSAEDSDLDVYYELIFHNSDIMTHLYFDSAYTLGYETNGCVGTYGVIPAGTKITIPLYYNWPYDGDDYEYGADGSLILSQISIIAQQYTAYSGSIPMNLVDVDLVSQNYSDDYEIIPIRVISDRFGYPTYGYRFESKDATSGYIVINL